MKIVKLFWAPGENNAGLLFLCMTCFNFFILCLLATNLLLYVQHMGWGPQSGLEFFLGNEDKFLQPRSYQGLLEITHFHLFTDAAILLILTHISIYTPLRRPLKIALVLTSFSSAFLDIMTNWLIRYVHYSFIYLKIVSFWTFEISVLLLIILSTIANFRDFNTSRPSP